MRWTSASDAATVSPGGGRACSAVTTASVPSWAMICPAAVVASGGMDTSSLILPLSAPIGALPVLRVPPAVGRVMWLRVRYALDE